MTYRKDPWASVASGSSYQIEVLAAEVDDLVKSAGGWLFDRMTAGWVVNVLLVDEADTRPLEILGLRTIFCNAASLHRMPSRAMLAPADAVGTQGHLRSNVARALRTGLTEITLWGTTEPKQLGYQARPVRYILSSAARAFKAQAVLAACGQHEPISPIEAFIDYAGWCSADGSDLRRLGPGAAATGESRQQGRRSSEAVLRPHFAG